MATIIKSAIRSAAGWASMSAGEQAEYDYTYTSLSAWEAAIPADLTTLDEQWVAECYNDWVGGLSNALTIGNRTTDSTRNIIVRSASGNGTQGKSKHEGIFGSGFYVVISDDYGAVLEINCKCTLIEDIEFRNNAATSGRGIEDNAGDIYLNRVISYLAATSATYYNHAFRSIRHNSIVTNCLAIAEGGGIGYSPAAYDAQKPYILNCVSFNNARGFQGGTQSFPDFINCVAFNCSTSYYDESGVLTWGGGTSNNAASDAATVTTPGSNPLLTNVTSADFVDSAGGDFHLSASSILKGAGTNLYSSFTTDVDGDEWPSSGAWDIGFDYYVAAGSSNSVDFNLGEDLQTGLTFSQTQTVSLNLSQDNYSGLNFSLNDRTGTAAATLALITALSSGTFVTPEFSATAIAQLGNITASASASTASPASSGTAAGSLFSITATSSAQHATPDYTATAIGTLATLTGAATATGQTPDYTASAAGLISAITGASAADSEVPNYPGASAGQLQSITATASAQFVTPAVTASAAGLISAITGSATGEVVSSGIVATVAGLLSQINGQVSAASVVPNYTGGSVAVLRSLTATANAQFYTDDVTGVASGAINAMTGIAGGVVVNPFALLTTTNIITMPVRNRKTIMPVRDRTIILT